MRILDLLEKKYTFPRSRKKITGLISSPKLQHLGSGVQAIAFAHKKHPNTVIKTIQVWGEQDPVLAFVRICMNHQDNPFFPRIYHAKLYDIDKMSDEEREVLFSHIDPEDSPPDPGSAVIVLVMEKLYPIHIPENEEMAIKMLQKLGVLPADLSTLTYVGSTEVRPPLSATSKAFDTPMKRKQLRQQSDNPQFIQAMRLLEPIFRQHYPDLHKKNIMIRKTISGPQLVLADPVSG